MEKTFIALILIILFLGCINSDLTQKVQTVNSDMTACYKYFDGIENKSKNEIIELKGKFSECSSRIEIQIDEITSNSDWPQVKTQLDSETINLFEGGFPVIHQFMNEVFDLARDAKDFNAPTLDSTDFCTNRDKILQMKAELESLGTKINAFQADAKQIKSRFPKTFSQLNLSDIESLTEDLDFIIKYLGWATKLSDTMCSLTNLTSNTTELVNNPEKLLEIKNQMKELANECKELVINNSAQAYKSGLTIQICNEYSEAVNKI